MTSTISSLLDSSPILRRLLLPAGLLLSVSSVSVGQTSSDILFELKEQATLYQQQIESLGGSFDATTSEVFLSLAGIQAQLGEFEESNESYSEAIQALRVTQGLYSESQLNVLEAFNRSLLQQQNWEQLDSNLHLANVIAGKLFDAKDPRYIKSATSLASWKIKAQLLEARRSSGLAGLHPRER